MRCHRFLHLSTVVSALLLWAAACAVPWSRYPVAPAVSGELIRAGSTVASGSVRLQVRSHDNATLGEHLEVPLGLGGRFRFDPISLRVAGQEYGKTYFLLLHWMHEGRARALWRADYSRLRLGDPIELDCDLDRPEILGPPCQLVGDAAGQPWLLDAGQRDYASLCSECHGADALGNGPAPDLTRIQQQHGGRFDRERIARWIDGRESSETHGPREMPVWGVRLQDEMAPADHANERIRLRIDTLVLYLESLQRAGGEP